MSSLCVLATSRIVLPILLGSPLVVDGSLALLSYVCSGKLWRQPIHLDDVSDRNDNPSATILELQREHLLGVFNWLSATYALEGCTLLAQASINSMLEFSRMELVAAWATLTCLSIGTCVLAASHRSTAMGQAWLRVFALALLTSSVVQAGFSLTVLALGKSSLA